MPLTQSAALMISASERFPTSYPPFDKLLSGGLSRGHIVEISGPPGTPKEALAVNLVKSFIEVDEGVLFVGRVHATSSRI
jgi:RAD51-like protein 2